jgi:peptide chain release factor 1
MIDKLDDIVDKYKRLQTELERPEISSDASLATPILKELKDLGPLVEKIQLYHLHQDQLNQARELLSESDPEIKELAEAEIENSIQLLQTIEEDIKTLLLPRDPADEKNAILEIRAGTGGEEAALFAGDLCRMYTKFAEYHRWKYEIISMHEADAGGIKEVIIEIRGYGVYGLLKWESGVHRVQRVPVTEAQGRLHTSAATVAVLPEIEEREFNVRSEDLRIDVYRSSGAGGQHVNRTESAVRITHIPTGIVVAIQDERSQIKNKAKAMKLLTSKLYDKQRQEEMSAVSANRKSQVGSGDRSEKIRTYNFPQNRLTDHRINLTLYKLDRVVEGELDEVIEALKVADRTEKLKAGAEAVA